MTNLIAHIWYCITYKPAKGLVWRLNCVFLKRPSCNVSLPSGIFSSRISMQETESVGFCSAELSVSLLQDSKSHAFKTCKANKNNLRQGYMLSFVVFQLNKGSLLLYCTSPHFYFSMVKLCSMKRSCYPKKHPDHL